MNDLVKTVCKAAYAEYLGRGFPPKVAISIIAQAYAAVCEPENLNGYVIILPKPAGPGGLFLIQVFRENYLMTSVRPTYVLNNQPVSH